MYKNKPSYKSLEVLEAVARLKSYAKAADEMCIDYTGVSKHIRSLENYFNQRLVLGSGNKLELTEVGKELTSQIGTAFEILNTACSSIREKPSYNVKVPITLGLKWLLPKVGDSAIFADLNIHIAWKHSVDFMLEDFDMAIVFSDNTSDHHFYRELLVTVANPAYAEKHLNLAGDIPEQLRNVLLVSPSPSKSDWHRYFTLSHLSTAILDSANFMIADSMNSALSIVQNFGGVTVVDPLYIQEELAAGKLVIVDRVVVETGFGYKLTCPEMMRQSATFTQFQQWLAHHCCLDDKTQQLIASLRHAQWRKT